MTIQNLINTKITTGIKTDYYGLYQIENTLTDKEYIDIIDYLSPIALEKGKTEGTNNGMRINSFWFHLEKGDIEIVNSYGIGINDKRKNLKIVWTPLSKN
jgi:hypothetical protein